MIDAIVNIYRAEDINGEIFIQPLKVYHNFFAKKISNCSGLEKVAWIIANAVTGIFAYPVLSVLAAIGILVKLTGIPGIQRNNQSEKAYIDSIRAGAKVDSGSYSFDCLKARYKTVIKEFTVTSENLDNDLDSIKQEIDLFTSQFKKVYIAAQGALTNGEGEFTIELSVNERI